MRFLSIAGPISGIFVVQASPYGAIGFVTRSLLIPLSLIRPHVARLYFSAVKPQNLIKKYFSKSALCNDLQIPVLEPMLSQSTGRFEGATPNE